jgi:RNA polymerase sigma-70 factor, ECF subfamily
VEQPQEQFVAQFVASQGSLRSYIQTLVGFSADADDVMQELSLTLWREYEHYDHTRPFIAWAFGIAKNHIARWRTTSAINRRRFSPEAEAALAVAYEQLEDELRERRTVLAQCIERLGQQAHELLDQRYRKNFDLQKIADMHQSSVNAINKKLGRIRQILTECTGRSEPVR